MLIEAASNYKMGCNVIEGPLEELGEGFIKPEINVDDKMFYQKFICPKCGVLFATDINRVGDEKFYDDITIR